MRTLLSEEITAGASGFVIWDGVNEAGKPRASGVYFHRIVTAGFASAKKVVLLH